MSFKEIILEVQNNTKKPKFWLVLIALLLINLVGNRLREYSYASVPNPGETRDEYSFGWLGLSLIQNKYPISLSGISAYEHHDLQRINVDNLFEADPNIPLFSIDKPWFDHPPLFGLITGGYAYIKGVRIFEDASVIILRRPMLKIALLTSFLIFVLGTKLYGVWTGLFASLLYSTIPTTVISSRLALAENGYLPLFLGSIICAKYFVDKNRNIYWYMACLFASIAMLFKLSAVAIFVFLILMLINFKPKNLKTLLKITFLSMAIPMVLFVIYGIYFDWNVFVRVFLGNSQRVYGAGMEIFYNLVAHPTITKPLTDGWIFVGWISIFSIIYSGWKKNNSELVLILASLSYLVVFLIFGSESYGWYSFPFFPLLIIAMAKVLIDATKARNLYLIFALLLLPIGTAVHRLIGVEGFQVYIPIFRLVVIIVLSFIAIDIAWKQRMITFLGYLFAFLVIMFSIYLSYLEIIYYSIDNWYFAT